MFVVRYGIVAFVACVALMLGTNASAETIRWHGTLVEAQEAARRSGKNILLFFYVPSGNSSQELQTSFADDKVSGIVSDYYEPARLEFGANQALASQLKLYRGGALALADSKGRIIETISSPLPAPDLAQLLEQRSKTQFLEPGKSSKPDQTPIARGKVVAGPIALSSTSTKPVEIATLEKNKKYLVRVEGTCSLWPFQKMVGADALYKYQMRDRPGQIEQMELIRFLNPDVSMVQLVARTLGGATPPYNSTHVYEAPITGEGKPLIAYVDDLKREDNSGAFKITIYELK